MSKNVLPVYFYEFYGFRSCIWSLTHSEFIFVYDVRKCSNFILLHVVVLFFQYHLLKRLSIPHGIFLLPLLYTSWTFLCGFVSGLSIMLHWSVCLALHPFLINVAKDGGTEFFYFILLFCHFLEWLNFKNLLDSL